MTRPAALFTIALALGGIVLTSLRCRRSSGRWRSSRYWGRRACPVRARSSAAALRSVSEGMLPRRVRAHASGRALSPLPCQLAVAVRAGARRRPVVNSREAADARLVPPPSCSARQAPGRASPSSAARRPTHRPAITSNGSLARLSGQRARMISSCNRAAPFPHSDSKSSALRRCCGQCNYFTQVAWYRRVPSLAM
jgi:hypothetical protein